jgi:TonB-linked SusC/RagA family outer membrane protein
MTHFSFYNTTMLSVKKLHGNPAPEKGVASIITGNRRNITRRNIMRQFVLSAMFLLTLHTYAGVNQQDPDSIVVLSKSFGRGVVVTGQVQHAATGKAASGVRLQVENFSATITDSTGAFNLKVPSYDATILVTGEGIGTRQVALKGRTSVVISLLDETHESFYDPVTTPFGVKPRNEVSASVTRYNVDGFEHPGETPDALLQGRIAGLNVIRRSGTPGAGANMFLRGYNSLFGTNRPLIVIDNMLYDVNDYGNSLIAGSNTNPLAFIDVKDIDNVTVLRDASSIYGAKGANGVIIITTARAKEQATKIDFAVYTGFNKSPRRLPVMQSADYRTYLSEVLQRKGMSSSEIAALPYMTDDRSNPAYNTYHFNTDWQDQVFQNSMNNNYLLKITGGDNIATYGLSMGYLRNEGIIKGTDLKRYNTRFNAEFNFSRKFTGFTNLSFAYNEQNLKDQGIADKTSPLYLSLIKAPFLNPRDVNSEGVESPNLSDRDTLGISNPSAIIANMQAYNKYYRFFGSFGFRYDFNKHWNASSVIGVMFDKVRENIFVPSKGVAKDTLSNAIANNKLGSQVERLFSIYNDTRLEYMRTYRDIHSVAGRIGVRYQNNRSEQDSARSFNSATDELVSIQNGQAALRQIGGGIGAWTWLNTYLNLDYGFKHKYFLSFNMAMDGSSRFGREAKSGISLNGYKFPVMPSLTGAWLVSSERFMAGSSIGLLKLRAGYSISGNDDIGNYGSRQTYVSQNLLGMQGLVRRGIANPALQWETSHKANLGTDVAFLKDRVSVTLDLFASRTNNMLVFDTLGTITGFNTILTNDGSMKNTGVELTLNGRIINTADLKWDMGINVSRYKNTIIEVPGGSFTTQFAGATFLTANGQAANLFYGYTSNGVFVSDAEATAAGLQKKNADGSFSPFMGGDIRFSDLNGDRIIDELDRGVIGNPNPDFTGGLTNRFLWKNFELNTLFTFSQGNDVFNYLRYRLESGSGVENQLESVNNRWRGNGHVTNMPRASWNDPLGNNRFSNRWIEDGSYFRLRSISLQYFIPLKSSVLNSATIYASGNNLFTLTRYKGYDPEFSASPNVFGQGIDTGLDPIFKSVNLGVRLGL